MRTIHSCTFHSLAQRAYDRAHIHPADVLVRLPHAHEDDWLTRLVHHRERRANLVVDGVEFGEEDTVDVLLAPAAPPPENEYTQLPVITHGDCTSTECTGTGAQPRKDLRRGCDSTHPVMVRPTSLRAWSANAWLNFLS
jgi:hypothetical protein